MFLTKKGFWKIVLMAAAYLALGSISLMLGILFSFLGVDAKVLWVVGAFCCVACVLVIFWGRYAEGKGKLINSGNKLVRNKLKPREFIKEYQLLKNATDLVVKKPSIEVLLLLLLAYDSLDDKENCIATAEEMVAVAGKKKKTFAKLIQCSVLFAYDWVDEAEEIFTEVRASKLDFMCQALADALLKGDRAMAMGDYKTVEAHHLKMLSQTMPKLDNIARLSSHYSLGRAYEKMQKREDAILPDQYCADNGGDTAMKESAKSAWQRLQSTLRHWR